MFYLERVLHVFESDQLGAEGLPKAIAQTVCNLAAIAAGLPIAKWQTRATSASIDGSGLRIAVTATGRGEILQPVSNLGSAELPRLDQGGRHTLQQWLVKGEDLSGNAFCFVEFNSNARALLWVEIARVCGAPPEVTTASEPEGSVKFTQKAGGLREIAVRPAPCACGDRAKR